MLHVRVSRTILATIELTLILIIILLLQFSHFLNLVQIHNEASVEIVEVLDAFTTENRRVLAAIEVLDTLFVLQAHVRCKVPLVRLVVLVHIRICLEAFLEVDT